MKRFFTYVLVVAVVFASAVAAENDPNDPKTWTPIQIKGNQKAPEFTDIDTWINSETLTMEKLKGKVVVIHFLAFG